MAVTSQNKAKFEDYDGFVGKFKPQKTTDDCYTPPIVYNAIADWVANEYQLDKNNFCRPFYPNGDYIRFDYQNKIAVDNPPFSILSQIVKFYISQNIKFFLFAPTLTSITRLSDICTALAVGADITYENGAKIPTSFVTNLEPNEIRMRTAPTLYEAVNTANIINRKQLTRSLPKYAYPPYVITSAMIYPCSRYGINFKITRNESVCIKAMDNQKEAKTSIFGDGLLISERLKAEREKTEREKAERWELSEREWAIISMLNKGDDTK